MDRLGRFQVRFIFLKLPTQSRLNAILLSMSAKDYKCNQLRQMFYERCEEVEDAIERSQDETDEDEGGGKIDGSKGKGAEKGKAATQSKGSK